MKKYRQLAGMTQEDLAALVNVRRETIVRLEAGKYNPSLKLAMDIAKAVGAKIEDIFIFE
ncbi:MAG: helix-turn-helix transcriptional regulator [Bacillota bacterium]